MPVILLSILWIAAIIFTIKGIFERRDIDQNTQILWTILIVVAPVVGMVIYYVFGDRRRN